MEESSAMGQLVLGNEMYACAVDATKHMLQVTWFQELDMATVALFPSHPISTLSLYRD